VSPGGTGLFVELKEERNANEGEGASVFALARTVRTRLLFADRPQRLLGLSVNHTKKFVSGPVCCCYLQSMKDLFDE
jgi:hypothetical protein